MYYLDGEKGTITSSGKYVLLQQNDLGDFCILNLETGDIEYRLAWNIKTRDEWNKRGYLNIEEGIIKTEFDDSDKNEIELRDSVNYVKEYTGWY